MPKVMYENLINSFYGCYGDVSAPVWIFGNEWQSDSPVSFMTDVIRFDGGVGWDMPKNPDTDAEFEIQMHKIDCSGDFFNRTRPLLELMRGRTPMRFNLFPLPLYQHKAEYFNTAKQELDWDVALTFAEYEQASVEKFRKKLPTILEHAPQNVHVVCIWAMMINQFMECWGIRHDKNLVEWIPVDNDEKIWIWHGRKCNADTHGKTIDFWTADWQGRNPNINKKIAELIAAQIQKNSP